MANDKNNLGWRQFEYKFMETRSKQRLPEPGRWDVAFFLDSGDVDKEVEVFEKLGVPQSNMVGVRSGDANTFFGTTSDRFDVISVNYPTVTPEAENAIGYIAGRQLLKENSILVANFLQEASRRGIRFCDISVKPFEIFDENTHSLDIRLPHGINRKELKAMMERHLDSGELGYDSARELIAAMLLRGRGQLETNPVFGRNPDVRRLEANMIGFFNLDEIVYAPPTPSFLQKMHRSAVGEKMHQCDLITHLEERGYPARMAMIPVMYHNRPYFIAGSNSYRFKEDSRPSNQADFFLLDQMKERIGRYGNFNDEIYASMEEAKLPPDELKGILSDCSAFERYVNIAKAIGKKGVISVDLDASRMAQPQQNHKAEKQERPEKLYKEDFSLFDLFGSNHQCAGYLRRLPKGTERRMKYFLSEDLPSLALSPEEKAQLIKDIANSKWCSIAERVTEVGGSVSDAQVYTLFDDIGLYCRYNGHPPGKEQIRKFFYHTLSGNKSLPAGLLPS